jgi:HAE1 family hydrophobic/amphiphilic exporter-1
LEGVEGVAAVRITGGLEEEILVEVDESRLAALGIPFQQVASRLDAENINLAGGILEEGDAQYVVRTVNEFIDPDEMIDVVIGEAAGEPVVLGDVGRVRREGRERETISLVNGAEAVEVAVLRESTANIVAVSEAIQARLGRLADDIPPGVSVTLVSDQASFIRQAVRDVQFAAVLGGIVAMLVLLLFLRHLPTTLIVATAIPISVVATFILMFARDISLNVMSLGGLALGVGMLVDSAIVVLESVARERERGRSPTEAARVGTSVVGKAVIASTLTTVAVFLPIVFVRGISGQLFGDQAWTVSFALLSALVVSLTLIPMLAGLGGGVRAATGGTGHTGDDDEASAEPGRVGRAMAVGAGRTARVLRGMHDGVAALFRPLSRSFNAGYDWLDRRYPVWLAGVLRRPLAVLVVAVVFLAGGLALIPAIGVELVPELRQGELVVELEGSPGTSLARMQEFANNAEARIVQEPGVGDVFTSVGVRGGAGTLGRTGQRQIHAATLLVRLDAIGGDEDRLATRLGALLSDLPGLQVRVDRPRLFSSGAPLEVEVRGYDLALLDRTASRVRELLPEVRGVGGVESERRESVPELVVHFDRSRLARGGLTVGDAAEALSARVQGAIATEFTEGDRDLSVLVRAREEQRRTLEDLADLRIETPAGGDVALSAIATLTFGEGPSEIVRRGGSRVVLIEARSGGQDLASTLDRMADALAAMPVEDGVTVRVAGQSEELQESVRSMQLALLLAVFLVYLVLASQFESFRLPAVILAAVPLALPGAVGALWITGNSISVVALIGMVMLVGIVVNNAIVFVDAVNTLRRSEGMPLDAALREAGRLRFRPIVMSTLTTVLGLLPLALIPGEGAELRVPLAVPVIGGLILSTLLTLFVVPVLYRALEVRGERRQEQEVRARPPSPGPEAAPSTA